MKIIITSGLTVAALLLLGATAYLASKHLGASGAYSSDRNKLLSYLGGSLRRPEIQSLRGSSLLTFDGTATDDDGVKYVFCVIPLDLDGSPATAESHPPRFVIRIGKVDKGHPENKEYPAAVACKNRELNGETRIFALVE